MNYCPSCGGIIGRDCFNPQECAWITQSMIADDVAQRAIREREIREYDEAMKSAWNEHCQQLHEEHMENIGFDPIALGM